MRTTDVGTSNENANYTNDDSDIEPCKKELCRLFMAVEQSPVSIVMTDIDGTIEYVNKAFIDITGYSPGEVLGHLTGQLAGFNSKIKFVKDIGR